MAAAAADSVAEALVEVDLAAGLVGLAVGVRAVAGRASVGSRLRKIRTSSMNGFGEFFWVGHGFSRAAQAQ
jgi:hypothetical protein